MCVFQQDVRTYYPYPAYGIEYNRVEVSVNPSDFRNLVVSVTCRIDQQDSVCNFNRRVSNRLSQVYYYHVRTGTIIGDGQNSTIETLPTINGALQVPVSVVLTLTEVSVGMFQYIFTFNIPADTGDGTPTSVIVYYVKVSNNGNVQHAHFAYVL
jgi:hypothetical protein